MRTNLRSIYLLYNLKTFNFIRMDDGYPSDVENWYSATKFVSVQEINKFAIEHSYLKEMRLGYVEISPNSVFVNAIDNSLRAKALAKLTYEEKLALNLDYGKL